MKRVQKLTQNKFFIAFVFAVCCAVCGIYYYAQMIGLERRIHSDDVASVISIYEWLELGQARPRFSVLFPGKYLGYKLFGFSEYTEYFRFVIEYLICFLPALLLAAIKKDKKVAWGIVPLFLFLAGMPGGRMEPPVKFHVVPVFIYLLILLYIYWRHEMCHQWKRLDYAVITGLFLLGLTERDILLFVTVAIPFALFGIIWEYHHRRLQKYYFVTAIIGMAAMVLLWLASKDFHYEGYGSRVFASTENIAHNIGILISGGLEMFNIPMMRENAIQFQTVFWLLRLSLVLISVTILCVCLFDFIRYGTEKVEIIDAFLALSFFCSILTFVFVGYQVDDVAIRYTMIAYYIVPIVLCRRVAKKMYCANIKSNAKQFLLIPTFFLLCTLLYSYPIDLEKKQMQEDMVANQLPKDTRLGNGIGEWWSSQVITVLTDREKVVQAYSGENKTVVKSPYYTSGYNYTNFFLEYSGNSRQFLFKTLGEPVDSYEIENNSVYVYDYDIRKAPVHVNTTSNMDDVVYSEGVRVMEDGFYMPTGSTLKVNHIQTYTGRERVILYGAGLENLKAGSLEGENDKYLKLCLVSQTDTEVIYEIEAIGHHVDVSLMLEVAGEENVFFQDCVFQRLENAIELRNMEVSGSRAINVPGGNYYVSILGEEADKANVTFYMNDNEGLNVRATRIGRQQKIYEIKVPEAGILKLNYDNFPDNVKVYIETPYQELGNFW